MTDSNDDLFPVHTVNDLQMTSTEQMGSKDKFWVILDGDHWLFKYPMRFDGERWSEMVAYHIGRKMDIPIAEIALGSFHREDGAHKQGTLSRTVVDKRSLGEELIHGNEAMAGMDFDNYILDDEGHPGLDTVIDYLRRHDVTGPDGNGEATDFFVGYLVFDALIGNVDRHHENWGVAFQPDDSLKLVKSFDHGACLGRELRPKKRHNYLSNKQVFAYVNKGRAKISPPGSSQRVPPYKLLESLDALGLSASRRRWIDAALAIDLHSLEALFHRFPSGWIDSSQWDFALAYMRQSSQYLQELRSS